MGANENKKDNASDSKKNIQESLVKKEKDDKYSYIKSQKLTKLSVECFGKFYNLEIDENEKKDLNKLKYKLMKALNIQKIQIEKILLFFRQSNQLSYKIITQNILSELDKFDCIKMILLPKSEIKDNAIKSYIFTNLEIQDAFLDNNKLKELLYAKYLCLSL